MPATLRQIAADIEAGEYGLRTTCLVILGHTTKDGGADRLEQSDVHELFACGPRCDNLTVRGLLLTAAMLGDA